MKKIFSVVVTIMMLWSVFVLGLTAFAETLDNYSNPSIISQTETQEDGMSGNFFQYIIDLFKSLFCSKIIFDTEGGSEVDEYYKLKFSSITPPDDPVKEGYTFVGWNPEIPSKMPWNNLTVKANWDANIHSVCWEIDGVIVKTEEYTYGSVISYFDPTIRNGYTFSGWYSIPETMPDDDVTISGNYTKDTEIVITENDEEFTNKVMELVDQSLNDENFDKEAALEDEFYMCRVIVKVDDYSGIDFSQFEADTIVVKDDGTVVLQFGDRDSAQNCSDYLNGLSEVAFAEADAYIDVPIGLDIEPIPQMDNSSWGERYINADKYAYYLENNNFNNMVTVAVVDSGIDMNHTYLKGRILSSAWDCFGKDNNPEDDTGHGTHVAGIIVNCTNNLNVKILPIKSLNSAGGTLLSIVEGITYAADHEAEVINLSIESPLGKSSKYVENAINYAVSKDCTVVVAAGNGKGTEHKPTDTAGVCPANMDNVIVVAALDENSQKGYFSNYGNSVDVIAPGVGVISSYKDGKFAIADGTSQAAPHISAVAAMFKLAYPGYTPAQIEKLIKECCVDKGPSGKDVYYGNGCPDMYSKIPDCTVSFNTNGGKSISSATTKNSSSVVLPNTTKSFTVKLNPNGGVISTATYTRNCTLDGWYNNSALSGNKYAIASSYMLLKDQTLYAKWNNPTLGDISVPKKNYHHFVEWNTKADGTGTKYTSSTKINSNVELYAIWEINPASDWVSAKSKPADAEVIARKYTYDYTSYEEDTVSSIGDGWVCYEEYWKNTGSGSQYYATFPTGFDTDHDYYKNWAKSQPYSGYENANSKRIVSTAWAGYCYWHWMYDTNYANGTSERAIYYKYGYGPDNGYLYKYFGAFTSTNGNYKSDMYYCNSQRMTNYIVPERTSFNECQSATRWFRFDYYICSYQDQVKYYKFSKVEQKESESDPTGQANVSNVNELVQYRAK